MLANMIRSFYSDRQRQKDHKAMTKKIPPPIIINLHSMGKLKLRWDMLAVLHMSKNGREKSSKITSMRVASSQGKEP